MRSGQFIIAPNSTNATPSRFVTDDDEHDLSAPAVALLHESEGKKKKVSSRKRRRRTTTVISEPCAHTRQKLAKASSRHTD